MMSAADIVEKQISNVGSSVERYKRGIEQCPVNPMQRAAEAIPRYLQGVQEAVSSGYLAKRLNETPVADWKSNSIGKGANRLLSGIQAAKPKMLKFWQAFVPHLQEGQRMLEGMPRGGLENGIARATAMIRHNAEFRSRR